MSKRLIQNATIATSREVFVGDVLIEGETIAAVGQNLPAKGAEVLDATGLHLLPGGVDPHTHFDLDVGFTRASDDFYTGSIAAACGGTTTVIDHMAFGPKGCPLTHQPRVYAELAKPSVIDYGLHGTIQHVDEEVLHDMETLVQGGISSMKVYMTYDDRLGDEDLLRVLGRATELGVTICAHCENHAMLENLRHRFVEEGHTSPPYHAKSRPALAEAEAVFRFLLLAAEAGQPKVYVVHLSSGAGLKAARLAKELGTQNAHLETCPQYLFLDETLYTHEDGLKYIMSPPLRTPADQETLWAALKAGEIDTLGTDHCPFFFVPQKQRGKNDFTQCPGGAPGVELRLPLLFSEGFMKSRLSLPQVVQLCCTRPAQLFGAAPKKGDIAPGADADLVLFDSKAAWTVHHEDLHEHVDYTPYEGFSLQGRPVLTLSRGEIIVEQGRFVGQKGRGRFLHRHT